KKAVLLYKQPRKLGTAGKRTRVKIIGGTELIVGIGKKMIITHALVSPDLSREMIIGAETMQTWDISIKNHKGKTEVVVKHDMREPDIIEVA
ncbi:MAG: hypothetical protein QME68_00455, partial [Elusimicrobiota bacterium]|nr:hypothetical protein [Elusimicrobiota bacterium]